MKQILSKILHKTDIILFVFGMLYIFGMTLYDNNIHSENNQSKNSPISVANLSDICITDKNNITICYSLNKSIYNIKLEVEEDSTYKLLLSPKD